MQLNFPWIYPVRVVQVVFGIIVLGLAAYAINIPVSSDTVNFMLFNGIWTAFLATPYLAFAPAFFPHAALQFVVPAVEAVTAIFWFAGFVATATILPPPRLCHGGLCNSLQAATVFGAFEWVLFMVTAVFAGLGALRTHREGRTGNAPPTTTVNLGV
ncbi:hypothetical protein P168DRAFT_319421 [Aspergillus campestris IBT 28561]|uniref:MARVEL domain-containing protein n=1 Tax=Aspergillus campestris (strain IBT 28561) TaxID=1392248 RepID=A0A2I1D267_ASPC2|nr:uncharacterized protein P168DRAFT_319421 [Aspergillus campestris IBT 28561]PKY03966.1 hypothetical protein P168DRAFT_319421 [Aspergillus campestris IBT 28561]